MSAFRKALVFTSIPIVIASLASLGERSNYLIEGLGVAWLVAGVFWAIAVFTAIGFTIKGRGEIAYGLWVGVAIGLVFLGATGIVGLSSVPYRLFP
ncbi:MAG TPA: hypothetical protein G4O18_08125 [Dehalococcoidia bacterium]|nr:hypothetical protein [Dehalococcoidia bacterium]